MTDNGKTETVIIAGGGIAGLATALALTQQGFSVTILEQAGEPQTDGAGIQLGPNSTRVLERLGVLERLRPQAVAPDGVDLRDGASGRVLNRVVLGETAIQRYGAPYWVAHRADLHASLLEAVRAQPDIAVHYGQRISGFDTLPHGVLVRGADGMSQWQSDALVAADGLWSQLRPHIWAGSYLHFTGHNAWRTLMPIREAPEAFRQNQIGLWLAPKTHLVTYPVRAGTMLNVVAVVEDQWQGAGWAQEAPKSELLGHFRDWNRDVLALLSASGTWRRWSLFELRGLNTWQKGCVIALGDAAHPILPFLAQGGALALEDAASLAVLLRRHHGRSEPAFAAFEQARAPRAKQVAEASRRMGELYHMGGLTRAVRDQMIKLQSPERLLGRYDWLYGYSAV